MRQCTTRPRPVGSHSLSGKHWRYVVPSQIFGVIVSILPRLAIQFATPEPRLDWMIRSQIGTKAKSRFRMICKLLRVKNDDLYRRNDNGSTNSNPIRIGSTTSPTPQHWGDKLESCAQTAANFLPAFKLLYIWSTVHHRRHTLGWVGPGRFGPRAGDRELLPGPGLR